MSDRHGPSEERLLAFAVGALSPPEAIVVDAWLSFRPEEAAFVHSLQVMGGDLLEAEPSVPMAPHALDRALARIETRTHPEPARVLNDMPELPDCLRGYPLGPWRWLGPGVRVRDVGAPRDGACRVILLKIDRGRKAPRHTHGGVELTCVLSGAYATEAGRFEVGDLEEADHEVLHQPRVVSDEACLCVAALDGQILLDGWLGRWLQPLVRL